MSSPTLPKPDWSLTGTVLEWPDGERAPLRQSPWLATEDGWTWVVSVPRGRGERTAFHTLFLVVAKNGVPAVLHRQQARNLIWLRLRAAGTDAPVHLGEIAL